MISEALVRLEDVLGVVNGRLSTLGGTEWARGARDGLNDVLRDIHALPRAPSTAPSDGWQPIETAPKDRTILVHGKPTDLEVDGDVLVSYQRPIVCSADWDAIDEAFVVSGGSWLGPFIEPTHWRPLPHPPTSED